MDAHVRALRADEKAQHRATYACAKQGGDSGDAAPADIGDARCLPPSPEQGRRPLVQAPNRSWDWPTPQTPSTRRTKQFISQLLHRPRHVTLVDVVGEAQRVLGIKRGVRRDQAQRPRAFYGFADAPLASST